MVKSTLILALLCTHLYIIYGDRYLKISKLECEPNLKYLHNLTCRLKAVNRYKTISNINAEIKTLIRNASLNFELLTKNDANKFLPHMVNVTTNYCQLMSRSANGVYMSIFKAIITKYSNMNHSCPFTGTIRVKDLYIDPNLFPVPMVHPAYKFLVKIYEGYPLDIVATVAYYADYIETKPRFGK